MKAIDCYFPLVLLIIQNKVVQYGVCAHPVTLVVFFQVTEKVKKG